LILSFREWKRDGGGDVDTDDAASTQDGNDDKEEAASDDDDGTWVAAGPGPVMEGVASIPMIVAVVTPSLASLPLADLSAV
jgi:hypothetical protein